MKNPLLLLVYFTCCPAALAQNASDWLAGLPQARNYAQKRASSYDRSGGNADYRRIAPGETLLLMDEAGPGEITHVWTTMWARGGAPLKALVLRMYWDGESTPSVESPLGDFFGLGLGDYVVYQSAPFAVAPERALNCFFPMPFQKHARITVTNEGAGDVPAFYFNIDYRAFAKPLSADLLYFHAQYRQASPNHGWTNQWQSNGDRIVEDKKNLGGEDNYLWLEAKGRGHFVGVTMSVLQNQDGWWGEGDDMFFIDGEKSPSITGTGSERRRARGQPLLRLSLSFGLADSLHEIAARHHRARTRQRALGQLFFRRLLVSGRASRAVPCFACFGRALTAVARRRRAGQRRKITSLTERRRFRGQVKGAARACYN